MALKHVLIELYASPQLREAVAESPLAAVTTAALAQSDIPGVVIDETFPLVAIPATAPDRLEADPFTADAAPEREPEEQTLLVRGVLEDDESAEPFRAAVAHPKVKAVYADPVIESCLTCINTPAVGTHRDVASALNVPRLAARGMDGRGVLLAIVDTGINLDHLRSRGLNPALEATRSWVPPPPQGPPPGNTQPLIPGQMPVGHGTMCAFDALIAAPRATLLDIALLATGPVSLGTLLSNAILAYSFLRTAFSSTRPGDFQSLVVSNSWAVFRRETDFPVGHPGNYTHNPEHPFNRIIGTLERAGADIVFAAGNCGRECIDSRCSEVDGGIYGGNSHPQVLTVAGVDIHKNRVGYSSRGPGHLQRQKPDICGYTHFAGSGVFPVDGGTSAATPVVAGVIAAFRSRFPSGPSATPAQVRSIITRLAEDRGAIGFDFEHGWGIVNGSRLADLQSLTAEPEPAPTGSPSRPSYDLHQPTQGETMAQDEQFMRALAAFEEPGTDLTANVDICGTYAKVKPILQGILPFIKLIPRIGKPAGKAIEVLMSALDSFCAPNSSLSGAGAAAAVSGGQEFMQALAAFDQDGVTDVTAAGVDICGTYKKVRPILKGILPFISLIPGIGKAAAAAITALMAALDAFCPTV